MKVITLLFLACATIFGASSCLDERVQGVCYCEFFNAPNQEYDLRDKDRSKQIDKCYEHNVNANNFGGACELE